MSLESTEKQLQLTKGLHLVGMGGFSFHNQSTENTPRHTHTHTPSHWHCSWMDANVVGKERTTKYEHLGGIVPGLGSCQINFFAVWGVH